MSSRIKEDVQRLFEFWCELKQSSDGPRAPATITECFPESFRDSQVLAKIGDFAYPCEFENSSVHSYSFVWTSDDSKFRFGFCRHDPKTRSAMVLITYLPWHDTFLKLLAVLSELRRNQNGEFQAFLSEAYNKGVPERGSSLKLFYNSGQNHFTFQRPSQFELPSIPENHNLNLYYNFVDPKNMIAVFAAMLSERRIIFTSRRLDRLSSCIQAANAFLYPMVWQHIFIPILPMKMKDFLCAPMPYLIGVPEAVLRTMTPEELGEVVILNCDNNEFKNPFDDVRQMPPELVSQMKKYLGNSNELIGDRISKIFLRILVQLIGGYRDAAKYSQGQKITWDRDTFIESRPPHLRNFLTRMMELQIFQQFIDERLDILNSGQGISDEFEMETLRYTDKMGKKGKNYRDFLRNVKDKMRTRRKTLNTNPAVKSAVKSVKEGSRGVKSAYKDLKSKLRDITPPKSQFHISASSPNDTDVSDSQHHQRHHSAPNSPVFLKRGLNNDLSLEAGRKPFSSYTQSSNSHAAKNGFTLYASQHVMHNNNNINLSSCNSPMNKSPTVSPSSSLCSSDMNISQELQNHPLFKSPNVDRSLKPSNSLEYSSYRSTPPRLGAPIVTPTIAYTESSSEHATSKPNSSTANLFAIDDVDNDSPTGTTPSTAISTAQSKSSLFSTETKFDSPPDMPPPPIPPKRRNGSCGNLSSRLGQQPSRLQEFNSSRSDNNQVALNHCNDSTGKMAPLIFENNHFASGNTTLPITAPTSSGPQYTRSLTNGPAPIPAPRHKTQEPPKSDPEIVKDLISLDESNSSFDLSDLDPLNQNAKPIPGLLSQSASFTSNMKATTLPSTSNTTFSISNPLYPEFIPRLRNESPQTTVINPPRDSESELLRQYGLDKFNLINGSATTLATGQQTADPKRNWTTFD
ncbi:DENN domain-containing protein 1A-like isoform X2 [Hermetia illucens]|uniref:DENN domain-containing protein 1A-like isoform X2 n=1 Tax=Hermetia illucens TaxID=343691 RepID=UPI0018CC05D9|nr:DENN domain-containing protein 1A-like isoform X2 [Hermetia illucens]